MLYMLYRNEKHTFYVKNYNNNSKKCINQKVVWKNDNYKLYFDRTVLTDIHIQHNRPDIINLNKQQTQAYLLDTYSCSKFTQYNTDICIIQKLINI
jgi:DNA repair ATPase RecN